MKTVCYSHSVGLFFLNSFETVNAMQHATCTKGPFASDYNVSSKLEAHLGSLLLSQVKDLMRQPKRGQAI